MHWATLQLTDQIFTHVDPDTKAQTTFAASAIRRYCEAWPGQVTRASTPITIEHATLIMRVRGIEAPRLRRALNTKNVEPLLYLAMPNGTHLLIDGSHTYVALKMRGERWAKSYIVPQHVWKEFIVEGLEAFGEMTEEELLNSHSGIPT